MLMDVVAGLICGLLMGSVSLGALIYIFLTNRDLYDRLAKRLPAGIPPTLVMLSLVVGVPPAWAIFGAIAGALYHMAIDASPGAGLGSSNSIFTVAILCLTVLLMLPALFLIIKRKKLGWLFFTINLMFAGIFGWLLPLLAHWR
jgi:LPXTG-motif cell wall-anchored protein